MPMRHLKRRHVKDILSRFAATPHKAKHLLVTIRKMITVALDEEWIETDPTWKLSYRPDYVGWRAWTDDERRAFEARWPIGTTPRTAYGLALWLATAIRCGARRMELAGFCARDGDLRRRKDRQAHGSAACADAARDPGAAGTPRQDGTRQRLRRTLFGKVHHGRMADWTKSAGLPKGCTLHGLRKTLGKMLAESGASTRQLMETLGHTDIQHAELYSREAEQKRLARDAMKNLTRAHKRRASNDG